MHIHSSEKISFQYENLHLLWISRASWWKNMVTLLEPGGKKWLLGGKIMLLSSILQENLPNIHILKNMKLFQKNEYAHCV